MVKQLVEVPETVSEDRIQQRTVEQIVDVPFPQAVEELAEVFRVYSQDRTQQRAVEQTIDTPATSLVEMIVEVPVIRTQEKTQQLANTHVQLVVSAVEAEMPKIIKETVRRKKPIINVKINQVTRHVEVPQVQVVVKTVGIPQLQIVEKTAETPQAKTIQGTQTSESLGNAPVRQVAQAENVEVIKIGAPLPAESGSPISFTSPFVEVPPVVVEYIQPIPAAQYVAPARAITYAHGAPVVEYVTPDPHVEEIAIPVVEGCWCPLPCRRRWILHVSSSLTKS